MTLVLPFGGDQINNSLFSNAGSTRNSSMPCVFDGEALDFESALMTDWTSDISDYNATADDFTTPAPSDVSELKRKSSISENEEHSPKKLRTATDQDMQSDVVSSSTPSPIDFHESSSPLAHSSPTSSSSSSSEEQEASSSPAEDDDYLPRRRGPQMWNSRQRWKDERKKVLKMSINKLSEIEDPELCLLRSVLINNTIKRLHFDIKNERQAKIRQRQQRMDYYAEKFQPLDVLGDDDATPTSSDPFELDSSHVATSKDLYDETSCDEIFGIGDDFLRATTIPDRRVSSPIPTSAPRDDTEMDTTDNRLPVVGSTSNSPSCDNNAIDCASSRFYSENNNSSSSSRTSAESSNSGIPTYAVSPPFRRPSVGGGTQCATQFRTNRDGDNIFPPRVPILDSVVYHSLLASLESS